MHSDKCVLSEPIVALHGGPLNCHVGEPCWVTFGGLIFQGVLVVDLLRGRPVVCRGENLGGGCV